jgi:hypothetical protein
VDFSKSVVHGLAKSERLVEWGVEAIEEAQLELIRALEEVLQLAEAERDVLHLSLRTRLDLHRFGPNRHAG